MNFKFNFSLGEQNQVKTLKPMGPESFVFQPSHPFYTQKATTIAEADTVALEKTNYPLKQTNQSNKPIINRLFSLPIELIQRIFEYDDTDKKYFEEKILCKTEEIYETDMDKNRFKFYQMILNNRGFRFCNRRKYCELIVCGIKSSWFEDGVLCEYPFPYDLVNLNSRYISSVNIHKNIYYYGGKKFHFIRCEMEIREFVKGLYKFLEEPEEEEFADEEEDFEVLLFKDWEDEYEELSFKPINGGLINYMDEKVAHGQYKKIVLLGEVVDDYCNLTLFADKNEQGKDLVYIQVDMDVEAIEDDVQDSTGFVIKRLVEKRIREIYETHVYNVIQVNKKYLAK